jgi:glycine reductase
LDRAGIPNVLVTAFTSIAYNVGANRIVFGGDFTAPTGDPSLPLEREKAYRRKILEKSLDALTLDVEAPVIFNVDESKDGQ